MSYEPSEALLKHTMEMNQKSHELAAFLGLRYQDEHYIDQNTGMVYAGVTDLEAAHSLIVENWRTHNLRQRIFGSKLPQARKDRLINILNLIEQLVMYETNGIAKPEDCYRTGCLIRDNVDALYGG